jgi:hypothetical protein
MASLFYNFDLDNVEISHGDNTFAFSAEGYIEYRVTPAYSGSYVRGISPEPRDIEILDVGFVTLTGYADGGVEYPLIAEGHALAESMESIPLAKILDMLERSHEFRNLDYLLLENEQREYYQDRPDEWDD